jgi:hypothetical protein
MQGVSWVREAVTSNAEKFWQYANEAMRRAVQSKSEDEQRALLELARTWTQAAAESDRPVDSPPEHGAP